MYDIEVGKIEEQNVLEFFFSVGGVRLQGSGEEMSGTGVHDVPKESILKIM